MKKILALTLCVLMVAGTLISCGASNKEENNGKVKVVCTIFPIYDWLKNVIGDRSDKVDVKMLIDNGIDLHNFQPTADDIISVSGCDLFVYVGGESDKWVDDVLSTAKNDKIIALNLLELLGDSIKEEEVKEGMEAEEEEGEEEEEKEGPEYDEHVWLSLRSAKTVCDRLATELSKIDADGAAVYKANNESYAAKLDALDAEYVKVTSEAKNKTLIFADRFPFRYMVEDYGLDYYAAFVGCSTESEASFETITFLAGQLDELGLTHVMVIEGKDHKIAEAVISSSQNKDRDILTLDSMQGITLNSGDEYSYLTIMEANLKTLEQALN